jgi:hypothetical protein
MGEKLSKKGDFSVKEKGKRQSKNKKGQFYDELPF